MKVYQCRENGAHAYSAATPILRSVLIYRVPYSAAAILQAAKARRGVYSLSLAFSAFTGYTPLDFCIHTCVAVVIDSLKLLLKDSSFFQKYTRTADLDRHSFLSVFLLHFTFLILGFLKKIGHTGIANTKKWLDQAVFPCWSNYHTLAGE